MNPQLQELARNVIDQEALRPESIPMIELYMDQVTTLLDRELGHTKRGSDDKIMTKTMINNYSKEKLLPPSNKKKYTRHHILLLALIYEFKQVLSIQDIHRLLDPLIGNEEALESFYQTYQEKHREQRALLASALESDDSEDLRQIASTLATRAALESRLAERLLDAIAEEENALKEASSSEKESSDK